MKPPDPVFTDGSQRDGSDAAFGNYPCLSATDLLAGSLTWGLITTWPAWMLRRVETIRFVDQYRAVRRVSLDIDPSGMDLPNYPTSRQPSERPADVVLPLTYLRKSPLSGFSLRSDSDSAIPLLTREQNGRIAWAALVNAAENASPSGNISRRLAVRLGRIATSDPERARNLADELFETPSEPFRDEIESMRPQTDNADPERRATFQWFRQLTLDLVNNFILFGVFPDCPRRCIVKFESDATLPRDSEDDIALEEPTVWIEKPQKTSANDTDANGKSNWLGTQLGRIARWTWNQLLVLGTRLGYLPFVYYTTTPSSSDRSSYHLEIMPPEGVIADVGNSYSWAVLDLADDGSGVFNRASGSAGLVHHYMAALPSRSVQSEAVTFLGIPSDGSFISAARWIATFSTIILWLGAIASTALSELSTSASATVALLLVIPGLASAYLARPREHVLASFLMRGLRSLLAATSLTLYVAAVTLLIGPHSSDPLAWVWFGLGFMAGCASAVFWGTGIRAATRESI